MGEKIADRATVWKSFSTEKQDVCCLISGHIHFDLTRLFVVCVGI